MVYDSVRKLDDAVQLLQTAHARGDRGGVLLFVLLPHAAVSVVPVLDLVEVPDELLEQVLVGVAAEDAYAFLLQVRDLVQEDTNGIILLEAPRIGDLDAAHVIAGVDILEAAARALPERPIDLPVVPMQDVQQAPVNAAGGRPVTQRLEALCHVDII